VQDDAERALDELRSLARGIYPAVLENDGLSGALRDAVARTTIPATLSCDGAGRYRRELEAAVYFCCLEALQNAAKHGGERAHARVSLSEQRGTLSFEISDDGPGFDAAAPLRSGGLQNMADRMGAVGGTLTVHSAPLTGTMVRGTVPVNGAGVAR